MIFVYILFILIPSDAVRQSKYQTLRVRMKIGCSINMTMIEENGERECECVSGYLYYPPLDKCFKPYSRGPCNAGEYFILQPGKFTAECSQNPCEEGSVSYQNSCHKLLKPGPPCADGKSLVINEDTFEITCEDLANNQTPEDSYSTIASPAVIVAPIRRCQRGSKMDYKGRCRSSL